MRAFLRVQFYDHPASEYSSARNTVRRVSSVMERFDVLRPQSIEPGAATAPMMGAAAPVLPKAGVGLREGGCQMMREPL